MARRFPLYIDLTGRRVLVYGGGAVASRRVPAQEDGKRKKMHLPGRWSRGKAGKDESNEK